MVLTVTSILVTVPLQNSAPTEAFTHSGNRKKRVHIFLPEINFSPVTKPKIFYPFYRRQRISITRLKELIMMVLTVTSVIVIVPLQNSALTDAITYWKVIKACPQFLPKINFSLGTKQKFS